MTVFEFENRAPAYMNTAFLECDFYIQTKALKSADFFF